MTLNRARLADDNGAAQLLEQSYDKIVNARRSLGLFQHHDAITGTARAVVMADYATKMFDSNKEVIQVQEYALNYLLKHSTDEIFFVTSNIERTNFTNVAKQIPLTVSDKPITLAVFNSLGQDRQEMLSIRVTSPEVKLLDHSGKEIDVQINPVLKFEGTRVVISQNEFEVFFAYRLPALSVLTFTLLHDAEYRSKMSTIYCKNCINENAAHFAESYTPQIPLVIENQKMKIIFDESSGFMQRVVRKDELKSTVECVLSFAGYRSTPSHSGAYLFKPDSVVDILPADKDTIVIVGPLSSEIMVRYGAFMSHTVRIYNTTTAMDDGIYVQNDIDFQVWNKARETEMFMRFSTNIENGDVPVVYTDLNGFQYQRRVKIEEIGIEGNYYPITQTLFIQDENFRLTLSTTHAQGAASLERGQLEVMLDRMTRYDDARYVWNFLKDELRQTGSTTKLER